MKQLTELQKQRCEEFRKAVAWGMREGLLSVRRSLIGSEEKDMSPDIKAIKIKGTVQIEE